MPPPFVAFSRWNEACPSGSSRCFSGIALFTAPLAVMVTGSSGATSALFSADWENLPLGSTEFAPWDGVHYKPKPGSGRTMVNGYQVIAPRWGGKAGQFTVYPGDGDVGGRERSDTQNWWENPSGFSHSWYPRWREDADAVTFSAFRIQPGDGVTGWSTPVQQAIVWQIKPEDPLKYEVTPAAAISARGNNWRVTVDGGTWRLGGGITQSRSVGWYTPAGSLVPGRWHDFVVETKLSSSGQGYIKLWLKKEGESQYSLLINQQNLKVGWREAGKPAPAQIFVVGVYRYGVGDLSTTRAVIDNVKLGHTWDSVVSAAAATVPSPTTNPPTVTAPATGGGSNLVPNPSLETDPGRGITRMGRVAFRGRRMRVSRRVTR